MADNKTSFGCGSIAGAMLSIAIILIRAFQTNAEPMSQWSVTSWIWMTMPWWLPTLCCGILIIVALIGCAWAHTRSEW